MAAARNGETAAPSDVAAAGAKYTASTSAAPTATAKSAAAATAVADEDEGAGCAAGDFQIDRRGRCRRRS
jgi:hypothetical protein